MIVSICYIVVISVGVVIKSCGVKFIWIKVFGINDVVIILVYYFRFFWLVIVYC